MAVDDTSRNVLAVIGIAEAAVGLILLDRTHPRLPASSAAGQSK